MRDHAAESPDVRLLNRHLFEANCRLTEMARVDGLTGIANRRAFDEAISEEMGRARRNGTPLSLLMLDVDHFKPFNDRYGHVAGDESLTAIAAAIRSTLNRSGDLVARYGGEEFAVLLPSTDAAGAVAVAERIRSVMNQLAIPHAGANTKTLTVSTGVAALPEQPRSMTESDFTRLADAAMYEAKRTGRNKVVVYGSPVSQR